MDQTTGIGRIMKPSPISTRPLPARLRGPAPAIARRALSSNGRNAIRRWLPMLLLACCWLAGCRRDEELDNYYGKSAGMSSGTSVNGTAVLADLIEQQGHTVVNRKYLTPTVFDTSDTIVWAPNDAEPPSNEVIQWFNDWLRSAPNRKLIFIGRDYDAAVTYWEKVIPSAQAAEQTEMRRRLNAAKMRDSITHDSRSGIECQWFSMDGSLPHRQVSTLEGEWADGIDAAKVDIVVRDRLNPNPAFAQEQLLSSEGDAIVTRYRQPGWDVDSDAIFVVNGSFLLNLPLVNHEHRKLAGKLVADIPPRSTVVFLESGPGGPPVLDQEPSTKIPTGLEQFTVWPQNIVLLHLAAAGIIFCFARWPIFGRAKKPPPSQASDFGQHVAAVGELLEATQDRNYAMTRHVQYQQTMHNPSSFGVVRDTSSRHRPPGKTDF